MTLLAPFTLEASALKQLPELESLGTWSPLRSSSRGHSAALPCLANLRRSSSKVCWKAVSWLHASFHGATRSLVSKREAN